MSKVIRQSLGDDPMPTELKAELESIGCSECSEIPERLRKPKIFLPPESTPNVVVSLDVMQHKIRNQKTHILVMIDHFDIVLRLKKSSNCTALTAFNIFYRRWISTFDAPTYVYVDGRSNLSAELMKEKLYEVDVQLCPVPNRSTMGNRPQ